MPRASRGRGCRRRASLDPRRRKGCRRRPSRKARRRHRRPRERPGRRSRAASRRPHRRGRPLRGRCRRGDCRCFAAVEVAERALVEAEKVVAAVSLDPAERGRRRREQVRFVEPAHVGVVACYDVACVRAEIDGHVEPLCARLPYAGRHRRSASGAPAPRHAPARTDGPMQTLNRIEAPRRQRQSRRAGGARWRVARSRTPADHRGGHRRGPHRALARAASLRRREARLRLSPLAGLRIHTFLRGWRGSNP